MGVQHISASSNDVEILQPSADRVVYMLQPIADRVAQNFDIISETLSAHQNSAHGIYDEYVRLVHTNR